MEIPKPDGGKRLLGIPTVVDRVIQQAIAQVLTPIYEKKFSDNSYGFRPLRSAKQAVERWVNYFAIADMKNILKTLDEWLRRRIRMCFWKQMFISIKKTANYL